MEEILALQKQLAALQEQSQSFKLSDRNVVEIVDALMKTFDLKLLYTLDGREYLTPEHLEKQIKDIVLQYKRINIVELPKLLNVGIEKVEPRVESLCKKTGEVFLMQGQLFTNSYLDYISEEINEDLQLRHKIPISEIAIKYNLPHELVVRTITQRLETLIQGTLQNNTLITLTYQNTVKSQLRGALRGTLKPISVAQLKKLYLIDEPVINSVIEELLSNRDIDGALKQGTFIPTKFIENQEAIIKRFYNQNGFIEYDFMQKNLYISKPKDILKNLFQDKCIFLEKCGFNSDALGHLKEQIQEVLNTEGFIDISNLLPSVLEQSEIESILTTYMELQNLEIKDSLVVSNDFLDKCCSKFRDKIIALIYKAPQKLIEQPKTEDKKKSKGKKKGESEEILPREEVIQHLKDNKCLPAEYDPDFEEMFYEFLKEKLQKYYEKIKVELFESKKSLSTDIISEMQAKVDEKMLNTAYVLKSIQDIQNRNTQIDLTYSKTKLLAYAKTILENLILLHCKKYSLQINSSLFNQDKEESKNDNGSKLSLEEKSIFKTNDGFKSCLDTLPKDLNKLMNEIFDLITSKKAIECVELLKKSTLDLGLKPFTIDKKNEKNIVYALRYFAKEELPKTSDVKYAFYLTLVLLGLEQNLYFGLPYEEKSISFYVSIILVDENFNEDVRNIIKEIAEIYLNSDSNDQLKEKLSKLKAFLSK